MTPSPAEKIDFLAKIQRLLNEGQFTASYKFALLLALADVCVRSRDDDSNGELVVPIAAIAKRFIEYYWRHAIPYPAPGNTRLLQQNNHKPAAILTAIAAARAASGDSLAALARGPAWEPLVRRVGDIVADMPVRYLQNVGGRQLEFLYTYPIRNRTIVLLPGVAHCLREFRPIIADLVQGAWSRYIRRRNLDILGDATDLHEFLFGSERVPLVKVRPVLLDLQDGHCFYCTTPLTASNTHVDHFISWARYPVDLGHNFVLADSRCNGAKRDRLPARIHLAAWTERNARHGDQIADGLKKGGFVSELNASRQVAQWAYSQTDAAKGLTWLRADVMEPLDPGWREYFPA
jgi:5-methylcytosine-specific restriction endonuclease McrA